MGKDFLYHYTNLFAFASIIKNRSIRFSPLSKMDDINDGQSKDFETISQYVFASSWTYSNEESIPFWAMYTNDMHGVRIGLPKNPFKKYPGFKICQIIVVNNQLDQFITGDKGENQARNRDDDAF